jgi:hypothetical protein
MRLDPRDRARVPTDRSPDRPFDVVPVLDHAPSVHRPHDAALTPLGAV